MPRISCLLLVLTMLTAAGCDSEDPSQTAPQVPSPATMADTSGAPAPAEPRELTPEEQERFNNGKLLYQGLCMACHQVHGEGQQGMAPTLVGTDWVLGSTDRLVRIVLQGLIGPIEVDGEEWNLVMPGHQIVSPNLTDEHYAAILTYIRRAWGNQGEPVSPETIARIRKETEGRTSPWTAEELKKFAD